MNIAPLAAAALLAFACTACHSGKTREKITNLQSDEAENTAANDAPGGANEAQPQ